MLFCYSILWLLWSTRPVAETVPAAQPARQLRQQQELGWLLFYEPALSANGKRSCASCHRPQKAYTDHRATARAFRLAASLERNTPTLLNATDQRRFFHDGRAGSLSEVIESVVTNPREFNTTYAAVARQLSQSREYRRRFRQAFAAPIGEPTINQALIAFLSSQQARNSPFDQYQRGQAALPEPALRGLRVFTTAECGRCHPAPAFRDDQLHQVQAGLLLKTPGLRNVAVTPPYGARGQHPTLAAAFADAFHQQATAHPLSDAEVQDLTAFLATLTDTTSLHLRSPQTLPALPTLPDRTIGGVY